MTKLYKKSELAFALVWIGVYVVSFSLADSVSASLGVEKCITLPLAAALTAILWLWIRKQGLSGKFGLVPFRGKAASYLYFLPLVLIVSVNLWFGVTQNLSAAETALYMLTMVCVGFLEEVIFRGLLFCAMRRDNLKAAVIVSSVTFGLGHIVNLFGGAEVLSTLLQIVYAVAIGFLFTILFIKSGSLVPCILTHSAVNALSAIAVERTDAARFAGPVVLTIVPLAYAAWILAKTKTKEQA